MQTEIERLPQGTTETKRSTDNKAEIIGYKAAGRLGARRMGHQLQNYLWQEGI